MTTADVHRQAATFFAPCLGETVTIKIDGLRSLLASAIAKRMHGPLYFYSYTPTGKYLSEVM